MRTGVRSIEYSDRPEILAQSKNQPRNGLRLATENRGDHRQLVIEDDGVGLPDDFDPEGDTGIGMRIVRVMSQEMGGDLRRDERSQGARFVFDFPNQ